MGKSRKVEGSYLCGLAGVSGRVSHGDAMGVAMHFCVGKSPGLWAVHTDTECASLGPVGAMQTAQPLDASGSGVGIRSIADGTARALGEIVSAP